MKANQFLFLLSFFLLLSAGAAFSVETQGGNITAQNLPLQNATSLWFGLFGQASSSASSNITINATAGNLSEITLDTGSGACGVLGVKKLVLLFSNSSSPILSLAEGNLSQLDAFINSSTQNATATFTSLSTFATASFGSIAAVPTAYTAPASSQNFRMGYLQDQDGNVVFITLPVSDQVGFNNTLTDYQIILPTNGTPVAYHYRADVSCNPSPTPTPTPTPGSQGTSVSPGSSWIVYFSPPNIDIPKKPPTALDLRIIRFSPYREVYAGDNIIMNPLIENMAGTPALFDISLSGVDPSLATPLKNVLIGSGEKRTVPFELRMPANLPSGYYSYVVTLSINGTNVSYPSIIRVLTPYRIGQPTVKRQFSLNYEGGDTQVILTVSNPSAQAVPHIQIYESIPSVLSSRMEGKKISSDLEGPQSSTYGAVEGNSIRWDVQDMRPFESRAIYYKVPFLITDLSDYSAWNLAQLVSIDSGSAEILVQDLQTPSLLPGEKGEIALKLFNAGPVPQEVELDILGPQGWKITPRSMTLEIKSRDSATATVLLEPSQSAPSGTYGLTLRIKYRETVYDKQAFVYIYSPSVEIFAPPISDQLTAWAGANVLSIALVVLVGFFSLAIALVVYRKANEPKYSESRLEDMRNLERMLENDKR